MIKNLFKIIFFITVHIPFYLDAQIINSETKGNSNKLPSDGDTLKIDKKDSVKVIYIYKEREPVKTKQETEAKKEKPEEPKEIEFKGNIYKVPSSWINVGIGYGQYLKGGLGIQPTFGLGLNTKVNNLYGKLSANSSILDASGYRNNYIGIGLGKRYQTTKYNINWNAGLSYLFGRVKVIDTLQNSYYGRVGAIGVYGEASFFYKIFYDIGMGATAFVFYNQQSPIVGIRMELYFSNAFKKKTQAKK